MTDKIQKIKEWISKTQDGLMDDNGNFDNPSDEGAFHILTNLDYYIDSLQEEPVSEDLKEAIDTYLSNYFGGEKEKQDWPFLKKMAIHFAEWQKQKDSIPVSEDLEEASKNHAAERYRTTRDRELAEKCKWSFKAGAQWQKNQMMKTAIETEVVDDSFGQQVGEVPAIRYDVQPEDNLEIGDKVKLIIIKQEEE